MSTKYESNIIVMTNEEIEKAANEFAEKHGFRVPYDGSNEFYDKVDVRASKDGFKAGAEFADKHWQEKTRWIPIEERLPLRQSRTRQIFCKNKYIVSVVFISCGDKGYLNSIESLKREFTHWKEIE